MFLWNYWMCKVVVLWFLCRLLGSFPSVEFPWSDSMWLLLFYLAFYTVIKDLMNEWNLDTIIPTAINNYSRRSLMFGSSWTMKNSFWAVVAHALNSSTREAEARGSLEVQGQHGLVRLVPGTKKKKIDSTLFLCAFI